MPNERTPPKPLPANFRPEGGTPYSVRDGDTWNSIALKNKLDVWTLILFNFQTKVPEEVNWYMRRNVGCKKATPDQLNWTFSTGLSPGLIYLPSRAGSTATATTKPDAPKNICADELKGAEETLNKSREVANTILGKGATSDTPYWFARLYQQTTYYELQARDKLEYPCFTLHFIPIFYDTYVTAVQAFKGQGTMPPHWATHFSMGKLYVDSTQLIPYAQTVVKSLEHAVEAHVRGDMAPSLEKAYRSFSAKYKGVPPFDTYARDFFELSTSVFENSRNSLLHEMIGRHFGLYLRKPVDPVFAAKVAEIFNLGIKVSEVHKWRKEAWEQAKRNLGQ